MSRFDAFLTKTEKQQCENLQDNSRIYLAEVMDSRSPTKCGDIKVWVVNSGTDKTKPSNWIIAKSAVPNCGMAINNPTNEAESHITSFGWWNPVPYVGNYVFIFYPCMIGENTNAYWFSSPMTQSNFMLPGIPYNLEQTNNLSPINELNLKNENKTKEHGVYNILDNALKNQGLDKDRLRGPSTASSYRDTPSHCYGFLSPLGNQMVIDDGWSLGDNNIHWINDPRTNDKSNDGKDDYGQYFNKKDWVASLEKSDKENKLNRFHGGFRFRTRNGTQLLILDTGNIYMINKDGTAWVELSEDGYIDCYSAFGISAASDGDINLHAKNVNIEATNNITMSAKRNIILHTPSTVDITSSSVNVSNSISTPHLVASNGSITTLASASANIVGVFSGTLQGTAYYATAAGQIPTDQPLPNINTETVVSPISPTFNEVDLQYENTDTSITSRQPTHEPWGGHNKNDSMPDLIVKQVKVETNKEIVSNNVKSNQIR